LAIADLAGGEWRSKARAALSKLCSQDEDASIGVKLLADIKGVFESKNADKLATIDILNELVAVEDDRPWPGWWLDDLEHKKPQKPAARLAKMLKPYGTKERPLKAHPIRMPEGVVKGYELSDFKHVFDRYLPPPEKPVTTVTTVTYEAENVTASSNVTAQGVASGATNVTTPSRNVTAPVATAVTGTPLVTEPNVTGVTDVTAFLDKESGRAEDRFIEEATRLFNAVPSGERATG